MLARKKRICFALVIITLVCAGTAILLVNRSVWIQGQSIESDPRQQLARKIPTAILLWSENGMITRSRLKTWNPVSITKGNNPRWSPDGRRVAFTRGDDAWLLDQNLTDDTLILRNIVTSYGTGAYWSSNGRELMAIRKDNPRLVVAIDIHTGRLRVVHDEGKPPFKNYRLSQCAESRYQDRYLLTFTEDDGHQSMIIDLETRHYLANELMREGDCEPAWSPDGAFIVMTRRNRLSLHRPLYLTRFEHQSGALSPSRYLIGNGRCSNASISNDSKYVLYVSSGNIYIWPVDAKAEEGQHGIRLTNTGHSENPSLHIFNDRLPPSPP